ncbi:MAG TPA: hypothetical protein PKD95_03775 [Candidatus Paceibacterota bacterium]|nr:hypothetical protein [Candidatus Paceibacterota bacterium]
MKRILSLSLLLFLVSTEIARAGFGITPPYVRNTSLTRNSTYEQQILLVRGNPDTPQKAQITIDAPEIIDWLEIVEGEPILLPRGVQKVPMTVRVTVPKNAEFKEYSGVIRIKTVPDDNQVAAGAVSISLGAQVDINLNVIDRKIEDFRVRKIGLASLNEGKKLGWLYFPGKIDFSMMIENTGNVDISPSKVEFRIFDFAGNVLLEETKNHGSIKKIAPYATEEILAAIPTRLPAGNYIARYRIYNGDTIKQEGEASLSVLPYGTLQQAGFGFGGLSLPHKISILLPAFAFIIIVLYMVYGRRLPRRRTV